MSTQVLSAGNGVQTVPKPTESSAGAPYQEVTGHAGQGASGANATPQPALSGTGFTYRHNWGPRRGQWVLRLNMANVHPRSHVFVSIGEGVAGGPDAGMFLGAARYTVHNVVPRAGGVDIWVNVEWNSDILLYADYLVVNPPGNRTVSLTVHRHSTVALTDADADRILTAMGTVLQTSNVAGDVATAVQFVRNGPVRVLPNTVAGTIQTEAQWNTLMGAGTGVKVLSGINWCSGPGGSIIGCAPVGIATANLAVVRHTANQEGILWAHEYGHNAGNSHRNDARAIMNATIGANRDSVDSTESARYLAGPLAISAAAQAGSSGCCGGDSIEPPSDVREFVSQHWIEGVPYQAASLYTEQDARRLVELLGAQEHEEFLPEIVTTLCFIGSPVAAEPLIDFVKSARAGRAVFKAKHAALIHLGDLIKKSGNQQALDFLTHVATDMGAARGLARSEAAVSAAQAADAGVEAPTVETLGAELAVSATFGLSLAATPATLETVNRLKDDPDVFASVNQAAAEAVEIGHDVLARGQEEYHRRKGQ